MSKSCSMKKKNGISPKFSGNIDLCSSETIQNKSKISDDLTLMSNSPVPRVWIIKHFGIILFEFKIIVLCISQKSFKYWIHTVYCKLGKKSVLCYIINRKTGKMLNIVQGQKEMVKLGLKFSSSEI